LPLFRLLSISHSRLYFNGPARKKQGKKLPEKPEKDRGRQAPESADDFGWTPALDKEKQSCL